MHGNGTDIDGICKEYQKPGASLLSCSMKFFCSQETVRKILIENGIPVNRQGSKAYGRKLTPYLTGDEILFRDRSGRVIARCQNVEIVAPL